RLRHGHGSRRRRRGESRDRRGRGRSKTRGRARLRSRHPQAALRSRADTAEEWVVLKLSTTEDTEDTEDQTCRLSSACLNLSVLRVLSGGVFFAGSAWQPNPKQLKPIAIYLRSPKPA